MTIFVTYYTHSAHKCCCIQTFWSTIFYYTIPILYPKVGKVKNNKGDFFFITEMETRKLWRRCKCPEGIWPRSTHRLRTGKKKRGRSTLSAHPVGRPTILSYLFWPAYSQFLDNNNNRVHPSKHRSKVISKFR